jgi:transposase
MNHYEFDQNAMVGRAGKAFGLGYKLHLLIDSETVLTLACAFASANQNAHKHSPNMLEKTKLILKRSAVRLKSVIADSQYSYGKLRDAGNQAMIPYWANQKRDVEGQLKVDKKILTYRPEDQKGYNRRPHIETVYSFLKTRYCLTVNKVRG